jgi:hypothetical protein
MLAYIITEAHKQTGDHVKFLIVPSIEAEEDWGVKTTHGELRFAAVMDCT